jgi:hypothetical protein
MEVSGQLHVTPGEIAPGTHWIGGWGGGGRAGIDAVEKRKNLAFTGNRISAVQPEVTVRQKMFYSFVIWN